MLQLVAPTILEGIMGGNLVLLSSIVVSIISRGALIWQQLS
jgi:hypothetical protein